MLALYTSGKIEESSLGNRNLNKNLMGCLMTCIQGVQEKEMDELLQWTTNLDEEKLNA